MNPADFSAITEQMKNMTADEARQHIESMSPEEKAQMERMRRSMMDLGHIVTKLKPSADEPNAVVSQFRVVEALASAPMLVTQLGQEPDFNQDEDVEGQAAEKLKEWRDEWDAINAQLEAALLKVGALQPEQLEPLAPPVKANLILLYWHLWKERLEPELAEAAPPEMAEAKRSAANQLATRLLIQSQMLIPQQRWVQPTLAVAKASALMANALWSHEDQEALDKMVAILNDDGLAFPSLELQASAVGADTQEGVIMPSQPIKAKITLVRKHAHAEGDPTPECFASNDGIYEAYWLYLEGVKPEGTANSLVMAQPMVVKDLKATAVTAEATFTAPPDPGKYELRVHITSTSVVGICLTKELEFTVVEDDVPSLE